MIPGYRTRGPQDATHRRLREVLRRDRAGALEHLAARSALETRLPCACELVDGAWRACPPCADAHDAAALTGESVHCVCTPCRYARGEE